ncbi:MAG TPA: hypothetical protein QF901_13100 [Gammaproteobacteria bacterium]|nr:hypothetical protein [Gammaproteobacteria bacterium]
MADAGQVKIKKVIDCDRYLLELLDPHLEVRGDNARPGYRCD